MTKQRKMILTATILYTLVILYFMFFAFGRTGASERTSDYVFIFLPDNPFRLPGMSDLLHPTLMDLVGFGNLVAFIPFGILFPWLYRLTFARFITLFFLLIIVAETIQALTLLGSFDINDALLNTLGAAIGFGAYKLGVRSNNGGLNIVKTVISSVVLFLIVWGLSGIMDKAFTKVEGPFVAVNELSDSSGNVVTGNRISSFKIGAQNVEPQFNMYGAEDGHSETFTYKYKEKMTFSFYYGIPEPSDYSGSISLSVDGREILTSSGEVQRSNPELFPSLFEIPVESGGELTITIEGNLKIWDLGYRKMQYLWN